MSTKSKLVAQNPLILRCHRVMEAFAKSDDEREFYIDRVEGFLVYVDLDKSQEELEGLEKELRAETDRYVAIPKLSFYEVKKIMEGFVNEKVYDIDTKEKLLDIIQSKEARENFLEFIYDHHSELEKWQQFYQERFRVRIIEWLRNNRFDFVFEEDLELLKILVEKLKMNTFTPRVGKDIVTARKALAAKAKTYYSNEALNPRPKRGRPPKQVVKVETEPQFSQDIYVAIPKAMKPFLFTPDYSGTASIFTFSGKFESEEALLAHRKQQIQSQSNLELQNLQQKLQALRAISSQWMQGDSEPRSDNNNEHALAMHTGDSSEGNSRHGMLVRKSKPMQLQASKKQQAQTQIQQQIQQKGQQKVEQKIQQKAVGKKAAIKKKTTAVPISKDLPLKKAATKARLRPLVRKKGESKPKTAPKSAAKKIIKKVVKPVIHKKPVVKKLRRK